MRKIFLILLALPLLSFSSAAGASTEVLIDGRNPWPPQGPRCQKFVACCNKGKLKDSDVDLFCQLRAAQNNLDCAMAIDDLADYIRQKGKEPPPECIQVKIQ